VFKCRVNIKAVSEGYIEKNQHLKKYAFVSPHFGKPEIRVIRPRGTGTEIAQLYDIFPTRLLTMVHSYFFCAIYVMAYTEIFGFPI